MTEQQEDTKEEIKTKADMEDRKGFINTTITRGYVKDSITLDDGTEKYMIRFEGRLQSHVIEQLKRFFEITEISGVYNSDETHLVIEYTQ